MLTQPRTDRVVAILGAAAPVPDATATIATKGLVAKCGCHEKTRTINAISSRPALCDFTGDALFLNYHENCQMRGDRRGLVGDDGAHSGAEAAPACRIGRSPFARCGQDAIGGG